MSLIAHINTIKDFATKHYGDDEDINRLLKLKLDHSFRVLDNAKAIIDGEKIANREAAICQTAALYHDIGRFPQFSKYKTFNDRQSINHGRQGVLTLREIPLPSGFSSKDWRAIRFAIAQHNVKNIRPNLPEKYSTATQLVRDADKIDIFRIMIAHFQSDTPDPAVTFDLDLSPDGYTDCVYEDIMKGKTGDYRKLKYANDFKLLAIGWVNDLHFQTSFKLLKKRKHLETIFSLLPKNKKIRALEEKTNNLMRYKINKPS